MPNTREKLIELCEKALNYDGTGREIRFTGGDVTPCLIANGVTVQECGHWVSYQSDEPYGCQDEKEWHKCSKCGKDAYGRCYEDEWYSSPILSSHCPHCGIKMMPQPPKGE